MARNGFVGPSLAYEGRFGLYATHLQARYDPALLPLATRGLGSIWEVMQVMVKPFPACHFVHAFADAALALVREQSLDPNDVRSIRALVPLEGIKIVCEPLDKKRRPANDYDAQFSLPFAIAVALKRRQFTLAELLPAVYSDPQILALCDLVTCEVDPRSAFPRYYSGELVVTTKDGRVLTHRENENRGCGDRPLSDAEIQKKYADNAMRTISGPRRDAIARFILGIEATVNFRDAALVLSDRG